MNVVLISCDQLSARWLGCYGDPSSATPNIDALAGRGVRFDSFIADLPVCMPCRAGTITGLAVRSHGVYCNGYELGADLPTFPRELQAGGVRTAGFGKFHLQCHGRSAYNDVTQYGFDEAATTEDIRAGEWLDWVRREQPEACYEALATVWSNMPHLTSYGPEKVNLKAVVEQARRRVGPQTGPMVKYHAYESRIPPNATQTFWVGQKAVEFLSRRRPGERFYVYVSFVSPHDPYDPPAGYLDRIAPAAVRAPLPPAWMDDPRPPRLFGESRILRRFEGLDTSGWQAVRRHYQASMAEIDDQVGRIAQAVQAGGLAGETVVLFTSDHGDMLGDHGLAYKGSWHYDACIRVPFIAAGAGVAAGRVVSAPASTLDMCPTMLEMFGRKCPWAQAGVSLAPVLAGAEADQDRAVFSESFATYAVQEPHCHTRTLRTARYRYSLFGDGPEQLFDLAADPDELNNLADSPEHAKRRRRLQGRLRAALPEQAYPLPTARRLPGVMH